MDDQNTQDEATHPIKELVATIEGKLVVQQMITKMIQLAKRELVIVIPEVSDLLDHVEILQAISQFLLDSSKREVQILLNTLDPQIAPSSGLIKLFQRLPSRIQLKQVSSLLENPVQPKDVLFITDRKHTLRVDNLSSFHAWVDLDNEARAKKYLESIYHQWPYAHEIAEFRQFII